MNNDIILKNNRLEITIATPGDQYRGPRFDWTGIITQIRLDDTHTFCVPEQLEKGKGSGGIGFCNEYNHNFIGIDGLNIDASYRLTIPNALNYAIEVGDLTCHAKETTWPAVPDGDFYFTVELASDDVDYNWDLYNTVAKTGVRELSKFDFDKCAVWGFSHVVAPELFIQLHLAPKGSQRWQRVYEFY